MPREKLHTTLSDLHEQLKSGGPLDEGDRAHLKAILAEIGEVLETEGPHEAISDRILEAVARFESSHPTITAGLVEAVELLKRL